MPLSPCVGYTDQRCGIPSPDGHCPLHPKVNGRAKRNNRAVRSRSAQAVAAHVKRHGWRCPGDDHHPAHDCTDLTADHATPLALGGKALGPLTVRCRPSNASRGAGAPTPGA